jgi:hypothetical protein
VAIRKKLQESSVPKWISYSHDFFPDFSKLDSYFARAGI